MTTVRTQHQKKFKLLVSNSDRLHILPSGQLTYGKRDPPDGGYGGQAEERSHYNGKT